MNLEIPVSIGEVVDKYTILKIKSEKLDDQEKLKFVNEEKSLLENKLVEVGVSLNDQDVLDLYSVNLELWQIEDDIRDQERDKDFGEKFIELARSVYVTNDQRFKIKDRINQKMGSQVREVKSYRDY